METEGHINGHISFVIDDFVFCGDTLFTGGCGYLFDGPPQKMHHSLQRLSQLPESTKVCCAHEYTLDNLWFAFSLEPDNAELLRRISDAQTVLGEGGTLVPSTIGLERQTNPFLRINSPTIQKQIQKINASINLNDDAAVFAEIRELKNQKLYRKVELPTS